LRAAFGRLFRWSNIASAMSVHGRRRPHITLQIQRYISKKAVSKLLLRGLNREMIGEV